MGMNNKNRSAQNDTQVSVVLAKRSDGMPVPRIEVDVQGAGPRVLRAELHRLAAEVELAIPGDEVWGVGIQCPHDSRGWVWLALCHGRGSEPEQGMAVLREAVRASIDRANV